MKLKRALLRTVLLALLAGGLPSARSASTPKPVLVHYMPWYVAQPFSHAWGWHWTMNCFRPDSVTRRPVASWYHPLIGAYDSLDPTVLEYHVLLMKLAGVDGVIVDWYGPDDHNDYAVNNERTLALLGYIQKAGLKFSLCYEDHTIQVEINDNYLPASAAVEHAQQAMLYAQAHFFTDPSYLRLNNAPVLLNFGPQYFKNNADWLTIFSVLNPTNKPALFTEDNRLAAGAGAFNWPPMGISGGGTNRLTTDQLQSYLVGFEQKAAGWPSFISSAFPRFHDIYAEANVGSSYGYLDDADGATLTRTLTRALTNHSALAQIVTWNDFGEGTVVEPTREFGYRDLGLIQNLRRQYLDPNFSHSTNDLAMALRFYNVRKQHGNDPAVCAELDRVFTNIISGNVSAAELQLTGIESSHPVIYNLSYNGAQLEFSIGGYVAAGPQVRVSTNLVNWQTLQTFAAGTNSMTFSADNTPAVCQFFKVQ